MALYLITGGCGFVGRHLGRRLLLEGHRVRVIDDLSAGSKATLDPAIDLLEDNICKAPALTQALKGVDGVFHLAAVASVEQSIQEWGLATQTNLLGTVAVLNAAAALRVPVVFASSAAIYGEQGTNPIEEEAEKNPLSPYAIDKWAGELHGAAIAALKGGRFFALRPFNIYGPGQNPTSPYSGVITHFMTRLSSGKAPIIFGDGRQVRDFVHVSDVVTAFVKALQMLEEKPVEGKEGYFGACNICSGDKTTIRELAEACIRLSGKAVEPQFMPARAGEIHTSVGAARRAEKHLGFRASLSLEVGLGTLF